MPAKKETKPAAAAPAAGKAKGKAAAAAAPAKPAAAGGKKAGSAGASKSAKDKALKAKKATTQGVVKRHRKIRTSVTFHRPKTLSLPRNPKYLRHSVPAKPKLDQYAVIKHPINTESAMKKIEDQNTLSFICDLRANKNQIKEAVKRLYEIKAAKVNTLVRPDGKKKAYVRLTADVEAMDVANKIGII